jgi:hypothetical protein
MIHPPKKVEAVGVGEVYITKVFAVADPFDMEHMSKDELLLMLQCYTAELQRRRAEKEVKK